MKIGILSRNGRLYSTRRLQEAARARGHGVTLVNVTHVGALLRYRELYLTRSGRPARWQRPLPQIEAIIPRIGASTTAEGVEVVRFFESKGVPTTAGSEAIASSRSKSRSFEIMRAAGLPLPRTMSVTNRAQLQEAIKLIGGFPLLIKLNESTHGRGVWLVPNRATAEAVQDILRERGLTMLVQEFIAESDGADIRLIIVGDRCVAAMRRRAPAGEFRSNLHRGGSAVPLKPPDGYVDLAVRAARAHQLDVAGVDIIEAERGPLLLELNSSPGLEGIEGATGVDVAGEIVRFLEHRVRARRGRRRQKRRSIS